MGTNYYYRESACPTCGRGDELHIGKSSCGWCFGLHVYPERGIYDLADWQYLWDKPGSQIIDEYGTAVSSALMTEHITHRGMDKPPRMTVREFEQNFAIIGPNNLLRIRIDGTYCIGHGAGTWDLVVGDFS